MLDGSTEALRVTAGDPHRKPACDTRIPGRILLAEDGLDNQRLHRLRSEEGGSPSHDCRAMGRLPSITFNPREMNETRST